MRLCDGEVHGVGGAALATTLAAQTASARRNAALTACEKGACVAFWALCVRYDPAKGAGARSG